MKILLIFSFIFNFIKFNKKVNKALFKDFTKYILLLCSFILIYVFSINEPIYNSWLSRESILLIIIMFTSLFVKFKIKLEMLLIYLIFYINILHIAQGVFGIKVEFVYSIIELLRLPGLDRGTIMYSNGPVGAVIFGLTGVYLNRITIFFDQPSTYFIMITLLSYVLLYQNKNKFALLFFLIGFLATPTKFGLMMLPLLLLIFYTKKKRRGYIYNNYLIFTMGIFFIFIYPLVVSIVVDIFYNGKIILDYDSSFESRVYWSWLYGTGILPWEVMNLNNSEIFGVYDGVAAKMPLLLASVVAWIIAPKVRYIAISMILTVALTMQYGVGLTMGWIFFVVLLSMKSFQEDYLEKKELKKQSKMELR